MSDYLLNDYGDTVSLRPLTAQATTALRTLVAVGRAESAVMNVHGELIIPESKVGIILGRLASSGMSIKFQV